jgi:hypothetical protein
MDVERPSPKSTTNTREVPHFFLSLIWLQDSGHSRFGCFRFASQRAMKALLQLKKLEIAELEKAYRGA